MKASKLKELITVDQIVKLMIHIGAEYKDGINDNELIFRTICHGSHSHKLYFYKDSKEFHCYSHCGHMDILNILEKVKGFNITQAISYICNMFGLGNYAIMQEGFYDIEDTNEDLDILNGTITKPKEVDMTREFKYIDESVFNSFYRMYHPAFYEDGISFLTMYKYGIMYDILNQRIIIPHRDELGGLVAVRCRNLNQVFIDEGRKYTPIFHRGKLLSARTNLYFYGMYYNQENIRRVKKVILVEAEKSVLQLDTILEGNNIALSLMSSSLSLVQVELLKQMGVEEVIIAMDKEYEEYGSNQEKLYAMKIRKGMIDKLKPYFNVSVIWDRSNLIGYKESPTDRGKDVFFKLLETRILIEN